jgi:hypothetical protein
MIFLLIYQIDKDLNVDIMFIFLGIHLEFFGPEDHKHAWISQESEPQWLTWPC